MKQFQYKIPPWAYTRPDMLHVVTLAAKPLASLSRISTHDVQPQVRNNAQGKGWHTKDDT